MSEADKNIAPEATNAELKDEKVSNPDVKVEASR
jgi:hypothetical protein